MNQQKTALVLSGGGIKAAAFHLGVCLALKERGFKFLGGDHFTVKMNTKAVSLKNIRMYIGSSAGAFVCALLANGYSPESIINSFSKGAGYTKLLKDDSSQFALPILRYRNIFKPNTTRIFKALPLGIFSQKTAFGTIEAFLKNRLKLNGFFTTEAIEDYLKYEALVIDQFDELGVELYVIATQLNHSRKAVFGNFDVSYKDSETQYISYAPISAAVAASIALPPFFSPKKIKRPDGKEISYFDGEIRDTLSSHFAEDFGATHIFASYSTHPYHYTPKIGSLDNYGLPVILNQALYQVIQQKIDRTIRHKNEIRNLYHGLVSMVMSSSLCLDEKQNWISKIADLFSKQVGFKPSTQWTYIHPRPQDDEMFFADHFSLNTKTLERLVGIGYRAALIEIKN
jgi:predicted acylesterase/phospholipase RssA